MTLKTRVWFAVFVLLVFVSGGATALLLHRFVDPAAIAVARPEPRGGRRFGPPPARFAAHLATELKLDDGQRQQLETILEQGRERLQAFRKQLDSRFEEEQKRVNSEIEAILTPEQRERFSELQRRMRARRPWLFGPGRTPERRLPAERPPL